MDPSPGIVAPTASLANKGRLESLLSRLGSESERLGALQMLSATAAGVPASSQPPPVTTAQTSPAHHRRKRAASEAQGPIDREGSSSEGAGTVNDTVMQSVGQATDESALQRAKKMQEKNKRAQARYRQRQREKMEGLDEQVTSLGSKVTELANINDDLMAQKAALQAALDANRCGRCGGGCAAPPPCSLGPSDVVQTLPTKPVATRGGRGPSAVMAEMTSAAIKTMGEPSFEVFIPHILKVSAGRQLSSEQLTQPNLLVSTLSAQEWYLVYKSFVSDLAMHLMEADKDLNSGAGREVEKLITSKRRLTSATHDCMGQHVTQEKLEAKMVIHMEPQRQFGPPPAAMWSKVAAAANFTSEQKQIILSVRRKFLEQLQDIIQQRRSIIGELQDSVPDFKSGSNVHGTITKAFQASHHLCESIVQEHSIVWAFLKEVCHESISPMQEARLMVASFPFFPDTPAICNAIAHESAGGGPHSENVAMSPDGPTSAASTGSPILSPKPDVAMSAIFNNMRADTLPGACDANHSTTNNNNNNNRQSQPACSRRNSTGQEGGGTSTEFCSGLPQTSLGSNNGAANAPGGGGTQLGEPRLSDTSFGLGDMWAAQQPLLLDSAWVAALPDLPLQQLGPGWGGGQDILT